MSQKRSSVFELTAAERLLFESDLVDIKPQANQNSHNTLSSAQ